MPNWLDSRGELVPSMRRLTRILVILYALMVAWMCFSPQPIIIDGVETPNLIAYGRLRLLLVPFNTFLSFGQLEGFKEIFWVILQNVMNVFLLFPLMLGLIALFPRWRSLSQAALLTFLISLGIESTQLLVDVLYNANRVFEIDDLWTNTLGGVLAFLVYRWLVRLLNPSH